MKKINPKLCRVCGLEHHGLPWGPDGTKPSFEICLCCGTEFGNEDATHEGVRRAREKWMRSGYAWADPLLKPHGWQPDFQVEQLVGTPWDPWA